MARVALSLAIVLLAGGEASAQASSAARKAAKELMEFLRTRFAREVAEEGAEKVESRLAVAITKHGDDVAAAARRVGPRVTLSAAERWGADGAKFLSAFGDDGARLLATNGPGAMTVMKNLGEEGVDLMIRTNSGITARRLPDIAEAIKASGRSRDVLAVLEKYGDRACNFMWRNKGTIFAAAALTAFLANPAPYLDGVARLVEAPARQIAASTNWTAVLLVATGLVAGLAALRMFVFRRPPRPV